MQWLLTKIKGDIYIWLIVLILTVFSVLAVYSSTGSLAYKYQSGNTEYYLFKQLSFIVLGLIMMYLAHTVNYLYYSRIGQILLYISIPLIILTYLYGPSINEARRWLALPGTNMHFQTSDIAKMALIIYLARMLSRRQDYIKDLKRSFIPLAGPVLIICVMIAPSDLSTSILIFVSSMVLLFIGRVSIKHLALLMATLIVVLTFVAFLAVQLGKPGRVDTWKARVESYFSEDGDSHQKKQANIAIANGGLFGRMPGNGTQKNFLPNPYSDFIYAIIIEEWGLIGGILMIFLYLWLLQRSILIVIKSPRAFGALLAVGLAVSLVMQAFINMCVNTGLLPVTGLTLPLVSMGGTSVIFTSISLGIILSVSRNIEENMEIEKQMNSEDGNKA
jgi:cell division protein FtsW